MIHNSSKAFEWTFRFDTHQHISVSLAKVAFGHIGRTQPGFFCNIPREKAE